MKMEFQPFDNLPVNLMTILAVTNMEIDIEKLYHQTEITEYTPPIKRRGRRRKNEPPPSEVPLDLPDGSIVSMILRTNEINLKKGAMLDKKKKGKEEGFKHSLTVRIVVENRFMCARIPRTGKLHLCGAKSTDEAQKLFTYLAQHICACPEPVYTLKSMPCESLNIPDRICGMIVVVMRNCNTKLGFSVIRDLLRNAFTEEDSVWIPRPPNPDKDYPGVSIQRHVPYQGDMPIPVVMIDPETSEAIETNMVTYDEYIATQTRKNQAKEREGRYVTFLVFADGSMIVTGLHVDYIREYYNEFMHRVCVELYDQISESAVQSRSKARTIPRPPRPGKGRAIPSLPGVNVTITPPNSL
jgi:TATA-box binding protein (TBP) (component of TFIID and TFIIIB)